MLNSSKMERGDCAAGQERMLQGKRSRGREAVALFSPCACTILDPRPRKKKRRRKMHWLLTPIDHRADIWKAYLVQRIVVEASDQSEARKKVAAAAPVKEARNPWLDPALTSCEDAEAG
jgi:hypothetical protein